MAEDTGTNPSKGASRSSLYRIASLIVLVLLVLGVWAWADIQSLGLDSSNGPCSLKESEHSNPLEGFTYRHLMSSRFTDKPTHPVALITLTPASEPLSVITNTCEGRRFFTALVPALRRLGASVIAIDKFYSEGACEDSAVNRSFNSTLNGVGIPVVVGQATQRAPEENLAYADCLVLTPPFDFSPAGKSSGPGNVQSGLTRLNENTLQIPLGWPALASATATDPGKPKITFSLQAAEKADATLATDPRLQHLIEDNQHPFATFDDRIPTWSARSMFSAGAGTLTCDYSATGENAGTSCVIPSTT